MRGRHPSAECRDCRRISPADADELGLRPEPAAKAQPVRLVEARQVVRLEPSSSSSDRPLLPVAGSQEQRAKRSGPERRLMLAKKAKAALALEELYDSWAAEALDLRGRDAVQRSKSRPRFSARGQGGG